MMKFVKEEISQFNEKGFRGYFSLISNWIDVLQHVTNFYVHVTALYVTLDKDQEVFNQDNTFLRVSWIRAIAAATCLLLILKLFDWCRLFDETAFFITLIVKTLRDIGSFIQLMFLAVFCFGVPLMILQLNAYRDLDIVEPVFDFWVADLFVS